MKSTTLMVLTAASLGGAVPALAEVKTQEIEYKQGKTVLQGFLAYDDAVKDKRPGVLVIHEWWGHNEHARNQATRLAKAGYVAFAVDMFGKGKVTTHPKDAQAFMAEASKDEKVLVARFNAALELLKKQAQVDKKKIGVIGYCFGGGVALKMARAGADLVAVGTFHAGLQPPAKPAAKGKVKAKLLVQTGEADPMVPKEAVAALEKEMTDAGASIKVIGYPGAKHGFTNPDADKAGVEGLAYHADADKKSWDALVAFFKESFGG